MIAILKIVRTIIFAGSRRARQIRAVKESGLLDPDYYARVSGLSVSDDLPKHYVDYGEDGGLRPSELFDPTYYRRENSDVVSQKWNLLAHFWMFGKKEGRLGLPKNEAMLDSQVDHIATIKSSGLFDIEYYNLQLDKPLGLDEAIRHYVEIGESAGLQPARNFDPVFYKVWNKGLEESGCKEFFRHYINHGKQEGRLAHSFGDVFVEFESKINRSRETVVVVVHETSRTGAPILGWNIAARLKYDWGYNMVVVSLRGRGDISDVMRRDADIFIEPPSTERMASATQDWLARILARHVNPSYAIVNGAVSSDFGTALAEQGIPVIGLIHDFASHFNPLKIFEEFYRVVDTLVFSSPIIHASSVQKIPLVSERDRVEILPQGKCVIPPHPAAYMAGVPPVSQAGEILQWSKRDDVFTVVGLGTLDWRKGIDLFVAAAALMKERAEAVKFRFAWIGGQMAHSAEVLSYVREQVARSEVEDVIAFLGETANLEEVYAAADVLFLSSRLDPLPNVAIDAMTLGVPVVCFNSASGIAEIQLKNQELKPLVVPYLNVFAAVESLLRLATSKDVYETASTETRAVAAEIFDMTNYVAKLDEFGRLAQARATRLAVEAA